MKTKWVIVNYFKSRYVFKEGDVVYLVDWKYIENYDILLQGQKLDSNKYCTHLYQLNAEIDEKRLESGCVCVWGGSWSSIKVIPDLTAEIGTALLGCPTTQTVLTWPYIFGPSFISIFHISFNGKNYNFFRIL